MPLSMRYVRRSALVVAGLAVTTSGLLVSAPQASAAGCSGDPVVRTWRDPERTALGTTKTKTVDLIAATRVECGVKTVKVTVTTRLVTDTFALSKYTTSAGLDYWGSSYDIDPNSVYNAEAGAWGTSYALTGPFGSRTHSSGAFRVLRASKLSVNATPEPVRKGRTITITGTLSRANWEKGRYAGYPNQKVELQYRTPKGSYHKVKTVTGRSDASLRTTVKATKDGCFRFVYAGSGTTFGVTATGDCVDVRG